VGVGTGGVGLPQDLPQSEAPDFARFNPKFRTKTEYGEKRALTPSKLRVYEDP